MRYFTNGTDYPQDRVEITRAECILDDKGFILLWLDYGEGHLCPSMTDEMEPFWLNEKVRERHILSFEVK